MKRVSTIIPGYDCVRHPCGKDGCGTDPMRSHGVAADEWMYAVCDGDLALSLRVMTSEFPASVPPILHLDHLTGAGLVVHVGFPHGDPDPGRECEYVDGGRCYHCYATYSGSDAFIKKHFDGAAGFDQPESFWRAMEEYLNEVAPRYRDLRPGSETEDAEREEVDDGR